MDLVLPLNRVIYLRFPPYSILYVKTNVGWSIRTSRISMLGDDSVPVVFVSNEGLYSVFRLGRVPTVREVFTCTLPEIYKGGELGPAEPLHDNDIHTNLSKDLRRESDDMKVTIWDLCI